MLYYLLAICILILLFSLTLSQKSSAEKSLECKTIESNHKNFFVHSPIPSQILSAVLLCIYGILGTIIHTSTPQIQKFTILFWIVYILAAPLAYNLLPYVVQLPKKIHSSLRTLAHLLQIPCFLLHRMPQKKSSAKVYTAHIKNPLSHSLQSFDKLIVREIMIPKVDIFALQEDTPIRNAVPAIIEEGYSRIPLYKKNIDNITGILLVKDLLTMDSLSMQSSRPIASVAKPPLYTPEIKKVSSLLQDFRQKHRHLAIVVNEYGITEGIVSMEDIIEEIFGEIFDEYDVQEDLPYKKIGNSWIVDGRMNVSDAEEHFNLKIDHENSYDTLGGHVFHKVGAVPKKGMKIHHENFDIEIITCSERSVGKLKITPRKKRASSY
ncbi:hypothetical protein BOKEGFJH_00065 [Chlamydia avium]|uniref:Transporter associated domain protein n=1 Tax=Chlamydia avium TaxID=1457141 RepID=A0ABP2X7R9_9CHLA|nr:hemolysin family protein [Chlamydia avium]EPP37793.1 transporter associated domain protein [Chlamydia psittaci 10_743_SC13]EPP38891.1 transporter associated domain protein [Chlamydia avium]VVT42556.1 hypothetical protein BOKEGFJH_00065 [Chlamydia avium]